MLIPRFWARAEGTAIRDGQRLALRLWGWSQDSVAEAMALATRRVAEMSARFSSAAPGDPYVYGSRQPLREEIIRYLGADGRGQAVVTRNRYGALVLNTAQVPFIDIDTAAPTGLQGLRSLFGRAPAVDPTLTRIREACGRYPRQAFRVYRTSAGYRVLATNTWLDPASAETTAFLNGFGADPAFVTLCRLQASFRARLTPKPWRIGVPAPTGPAPTRSGGAKRIRRLAAEVRDGVTCVCDMRVRRGDWQCAARRRRARHRRRARSSHASDGEAAAGLRSAPRCAEAAHVRRRNALMVT
jgi:hypothetical protein